MTTGTHTHTEKLEAHTHTDRPEGGEEEEREDTVMGEKAQEG